MGFRVFPLRVSGGIGFRVYRPRDDQKGSGFWGAFWSFTVRGVSYRFLGCT